MTMVVVLSLVLLLLLATNIIFQSYAVQAIILQFDNQKIRWSVPTLLKHNTVGAWAPAKFKLEALEGRSQINGIHTLIRHGFNEYYFVMRNYIDPKAMKATDELLKSSDNTTLRIIIILLPPSEGGISGNYDWKGWISYFNSIKANHPSFEGFAIDDFNAMSLSTGLKFKNNLQYMLYSNLSNALYNKRNDLKFYPVVYFEGQGIKTIINEYGKLLDGVIAVSISPDSVLHLEENLKTMEKIFNGNPIKYIVYPIAVGGSDKYQPSDFVILAVLSIASRTASGGIIIYSGVDKQIILDYLYNKDDTRVLVKNSFDRKTTN